MVSVDIELSRHVSACRVNSIFRVSQCSQSENYVMKETVAFFSVLVFVNNCALWGSNFGPGVTKLILWVYLPDLFVELCRGVSCIIVRCSFLRAIGNCELSLLTILYTCIYCVARLYSCIAPIINCDNDK